MKEELNKKLKEAGEEKRALDKVYSTVAAFRLVIFLLAVVLLYMSVHNHSMLMLLFFIALTVVFIYLVKLHNDLDDKLLGIKARTAVINRYILRLGTGWKTFKENGNEFLNKNMTMAHDLDLLGPASLYQLISVAHTDMGKKKLAETITLERDNSKNIDKRYEAIAELSENRDFLIDFESASERIVEIREKDKLKSTGFFDDVDENEQEEAVKDDKPIETFPAWIYLLMVLVPVINIVAIVMVLSGGMNPARILVSFILGLILTWGPQAVTEKLSAPVKAYGSVAQDYLKLLSLISSQTFKCELLKGIHERVSSRDGLLPAIKKLGTIGTFYNISYNPIVHMVLSGFLAWDYYIALATFRWNKKNSTVFDDSIEIISDVEELSSFAVLPLVRRSVKPDVSFDYSDIKLSMDKVYHPLLDTDTVVSNSAVIEDKLNVITGSNMSGKTTFLRTVAINMVLAFTGSSVCADGFSVPYMKIFTSMRVMDDVSGGISTFYAEILRIKEMAEYVQSDPEVPALCLIDEIFKGTNSADRIVGASEALTKLSAGKSLVMVSTHDFELCELKRDDGTEARNYHFEEYYEGSSLKFDYTIKDGRCTTRNAIAILKMAGLVQN
ncbi:MAG: DNA mismatch repair protein MutS [Eubacterium sp.]|nr:DNA mismatch repair protein MutS [Eubacterium sp.]